MEPEPLDLAHFNNSDDEVNPPVVVEAVAAVRGMCSAYFRTRLP